MEYDGERNMVDDATRYLSSTAPVQFSLAAAQNSALGAVNIVYGSGA
jgi:hypothetical protein